MNKVLDIDMPANVRWRSSWWYLRCGKHDLQKSSAFVPTLSLRSWAVSWIDEGRKSLRDWATGDGHHLIGSSLRISRTGNSLCNLSFERLFSDRVESLLHNGRYLKRCLWQRQDESLTWILDLRKIIVYCGSEALAGKLQVNSTGYAHDIAERFHETDEMSRDL